MVVGIAVLLGLLGYGGLYRENKQGYFNVPYGKKIPADMICSNGKLVGSINAGLMLLKPDVEELANIKNDINKNIICKGLKKRPRLEY